MQTITLSDNAVAVLRFEIKGWRAKNQNSRLEANRELAAAGIMEPVLGSETITRSGISAMTGGRSWSRIRVGASPARMGGR